VRSGRRPGAPPPGRRRGRASAPRRAGAAPPRAADPGPRAGDGATAAAVPKFEVIHHPDRDRSVFMPFVPAIRINRGRLLWLAGTTALPVYHDHPHRREDILAHLPDDLEAQTRRAMEGIKATLAAAGATFADVVHVFVFRARPRIGDIGRTARIIDEYFAPYGHRPTSTNLAVLELGEPEQLIEIQMVAVVD